MAWNYSNTTLETTLTASVSPSATTISVASITGLPVSFPFTLILDFEQPTVEVVSVTGLAGLNLTVTRGEDGTAAQAHSLGAKVVHGLVARDAREPQTHIAATQDVHGVGPANAVVGTGTVQTLTNKTISGASNTLSNIPPGAITQPFTNGLTSIRPAATDASYLATVTGDTIHRYVAYADGKQEWGAGGVSSRDTNLYRPSADVLKTDDTFEAGGDINVGAAGQFQAIRSTQFSHALRARVTTDSEYRLAMSTDGRIEWGDGTNPRDTNLYRSVANVLKTDDDLVIGGKLHVFGSQPVTVAAAGGDTSITNTAPSPGTNTCGLTFVAPPSGKVYIVVTAFIEHDGSGICHCGWELRTGATIGAGTLLDTADQTDALITNRHLNASLRKLVTGLTVGSSYNVRTMQWVSLGVGQVWSKSLLVEPVH